VPRLPGTTRPSTRTTDPFTAQEHIVNTNTLAAALVGFLLGGLTVSVAAQLEDDDKGESPHGVRAPHSLVQTLH